MPKNEAAPEGTIPKEVLLAVGARRALNERADEDADKVKTDILTKQATVAALGVVVGTGDGDATTGTDSLQGLQREALMGLLESLKIDSDDRKAKKEAKEEELRRAINARNHNIKIEREQKALQQSFCNHQKENGRSRLGGQRLSNGHYIFLCTLCHKEWDETSIPPHLAIPMEWVGGA